MWEISNSQQFTAFFIAIAFGIGFSFFYTIFKAVRLSVRHTSFAVFIEDIIFFQIISLITFLLLLALTDGEIRFFILLGIFLGFIGFYFLAAKFLSKILARIIGFFIIIIRRIFLLFSTAFGIFFKTMGKIGVYCGEKSRNCYKYLKKLLKAPGKMVYTKENKQKV